MIIYTVFNLNWKMGFPKQDCDRRCKPAEAIRTAGSNAENRASGWQLVLPY